MGLQPNIARRRSFAIKQCNRCGNSFAPSNFAMTKSIFYPDGSLPICNDCVEFYLEKGLMYDKGINEINNRIDKLTKDMTYIKKLLEQLFSNISFSENIDTQNNELLKEFKNSFLKDKYFDQS